MSLPTTTSALASGGGAAGGGGSKPLALAEGGEVEVCYLVNTAEYCADTVPQVGGSGCEVCPSFFAEGGVGAMESVGTRRDLMPTTYTHAHSPS